MKVLSLADVRQRLSEVVSDVDDHHEQVLITKNGRPAAVVISAEEWEEIEETAFWRAQPRITEEIEQGRREIAEGGASTAADLQRLVERRRRK